MGVDPTVGPFLLPNILPGLRCGYPALRLYLVEDLTARLVEELRPGELLLLKEGHCLREQALSACRLADRKQIEAVEATSLHTLMEMQRVEFAMYAPAIGQASLTEGTVTAGREVLLGRRRGPLALLRSPVSDPT